MDKFTAEKIRSDILKPLTELARDIGTVADELDLAFEDRAVKRAWLPVNEGAADRAIKMLRRFFRRELRSKLNDAKEGTLRYREAELKFAKKRAKKTAKKTDANGDDE